MIRLPIPLLPAVALALVAMTGLTPAVYAQGTPPPAAVDDETRQANDVIMRWINAIGGVSEVGGLRTGYIQSKIDFGNGLPPIDLLIQAGPGFYRFEYSLPKFGTLIQAFDGQTAWQYNETLGFGFLTQAENQLNFTMTDFRAPVRVAAWFPKRRILPEVTIEGKKLRPVILTTASEYEEKWFFDPETGYRRRVEVLGSQEPLVMEFDDFRPAFGARVKEPYRVVRVEGKRRTVATVATILYNEPVERLLFSPPLGPTEDNRRLEQLLERSASVMGYSLLRDVRTRVTEQTMRVTTSGLEVAITVYQKRPNLLLVEQEAPGLGRSARGYDGKVGWAWTELEGYREMQGAELQQLLAMTDLDGPMKIGAICRLRKFLDEKTVQGRPAVGVAMSTLAGPEGNFYFDKRSGELLELETFIQSGPDGRLKVVAEFADYRRIDGMLIPHTTTMTNPAMQMVTRVKSVKYNVPLEDDFFKPRKN